MYDVIIYIYVKQQFGVWYYDLSLNYNYRHPGP